MKNIQENTVGILILRFDDTNPAKEKLEYYKAISDGLEWLKIEPSIIKNTSDDIEILYDYGRKLSKKIVPISVNVILNQLNSIGQIDYLVIAD